MFSFCYWYPKYQWKQVHDDFSDSWKVVRLNEKGPHSILLSTFLLGFIHMISTCVRRVGAYETWDDSLVCAVPTAAEPGEPRWVLG